MDTDNREVRACAGSGGGNDQGEVNREQGDICNTVSNKKIK